MGAHEVKLTTNDRLILKSYETMLDGLAEYLGDGYEIVLHSLEDFEHSIIKIVNGYHTGRKPGAPITDLALSMLDRITEQGGTRHIAYFTNNKKGEPLKSCTIAILGEGGKIIGLICMNFYLNTPISQLITTLTEPVSSPERLETFGESTTELIEQAVARARSTVMSNSAISSSLKNREVVAQLHAQGIFKFKNAVDHVAQMMGISKNTVYLHLRNIKKQP